MHAQILFPLKLRRRTLLTHLPGAIHTVNIMRANVAATWPMLMGGSYHSQMTTPISVTGRNLVCVGNCICLISISVHAQCWTCVCVFVCACACVCFCGISFMDTELPERS